MFVLCFFCQLQKRQLLPCGASKDVSSRILAFVRQPPLPPDGWRWMQKLATRASNSGPRFLPSIGIPTSREVHVRQCFDVAPVFVPICWVRLPKAHTGIDFFNVGAVVVGTLRKQRNGVSAGAEKQSAQMSRVHACAECAGAEFLKITKASATQEGFRHSTRKPL